MTPNAAPSSAPSTSQRRAGSNADITAALKTLPGAQQIGEQEGLFVRGGAGYEAKQYIDGTLVNNPYYTSVPDIAQRGRFSPFLFKGTVFSTGGYSALYGQALSSVVLLESIDLPEKSEIDATISPLVVGLGPQQLAKDKQSSWGFSYNYVNAYAYFPSHPTGRRLFSHAPVPQCRRQLPHPYQERWHDKNTTPPSPITNWACAARIMTASI